MKPVRKRCEVLSSVTNFLHRQCSDDWCCSLLYDFLAGKRDGLDLNAVPNLKLGER